MRIDVERDRATVLYELEAEDLKLHELMEPPDKVTPPPLNDVITPPRCYQIAFYIPCLSCDPTD